MTRSRNALSSAALAVGLAAALAAMPFDSFMKIDGIEGESRSPGHDKWIEVLSYQWVVPRASSPASTSKAPASKAGAAAKCASGELVIVKKVDKASPKLMQAAASGTHVPAVQIDSGAEKHRLEQVIISSVKPRGSGQDNVPLEEVSFNYAKCTYHYVKQGEKGSPKGTPKAGGYGTVQPETAPAGTAGKASSGATTTGAAAAPKEGSASAPAPPPTPKP